MNPIELWPAVFVALGFVLVAPAWMYWSGEAMNSTGLPTSWMVGLLLPLGILLALVSWVD